MKITFEYTTRAAVDITDDEAREVFGLGGTDSESLPFRISLLAPCTHDLDKLRGLATFAAIRPALLEAGRH